MTDHLKKAKHDLYHSERDDLEYGYLYAAQSIAHALIAIAERLGTPKSRIDPHDWSQAMDKVKTGRVRACPFCSGEECSH